MPPPYDSEHSGTVELATAETIGYRCLGEGGPAVMLEAGTDAAGTSAFPVEFVASIAEEGHPKGTHVASLKISDS